MKRGFKVLIVNKKYSRDKKIIVITAYAAIFVGAFLIVLGVVTGAPWIAWASIAYFAPLPYLFLRNYRLECDSKGLRVTWREYARLSLAPAVPLVCVVATTAVAMYMAAGAQGPIIFLYFNSIFLVVLLLILFFPQILVFSYGATKTEDAGIIERVAAIANRLGVRQIKTYILPWKGLKVANALQTGTFSNKSIFISDYLLQEMKPREVDTIIAHELAHAKGRHVLKKALLIAPLIFVEINAIAWYFIALDPFILVIFFAAVIIELVSIPLLLMPLSRRFETEADLAAVEVTGDPEAATSALIRLRELNLIHGAPKRGRWLNSHPTFEARIEAITRRGVDMKMRDGNPSGDQRVDANSVSF